MSMQARRTPELPIETPLGDGAVELVEFEGEEKISDLFNFRLKMSSEDGDVDINQLVGKPISFGIRTRDRKDTRWWNGITKKARLLPQEDQVYYYEAEVVPWLWFLTRTSDCVVNQDISVVELIRQTFIKYGFKEGKDFDTKKLEGKYTNWEYCTQYRESAFNFVSRLMEAEGIFYFFKHEKGQHTLVMGDRPTVFQPSKHQESVKMRHASGAGADRPHDMVRAWEYHSAFRSGKYTHRDYHFTKPDNPMHSETPAKRKKEGSSKWEIYDYPGEYEEIKDGDDWANLRMEEEEVGNDFGTGESDVRAMSAGIKFNLEDHDRRDQNGAYVVTEVRHRGKEGSQFVGQMGRGASDYSNSFKCIRSSHQYRPERKSPKHVMRGLQSAVVVAGTKGEEIYCDQHGRVKVQFHWDRLSKKDDGSSCWIRVAEPWAGKGFGFVFLPRVGQEVLVDFLEGDPDRPIIIGRVYNTSQKQPWELPQSKNCSGIRTRSTKGGGPDNFNEIKFDDTKGSEVFSMHAERDMKISVERHMQIQVDKNCHEAILGERRLSVEKNNSITVQGSMAEKVAGSHTSKVNGSVEIDADGNITIKAGGNIALEAGGTITLKAGMGINMKGAGGRISANAMGVTIDGTMVLINCGSPDLTMVPPGLNKLPVSPEMIDKIKAAALGSGGLSGLAGALGAAANGLASAAGAAMSGMMGVMQGGLSQAAGLLGAGSQIAKQSGLGPQLMKGLKDLAGQAADGVQKAAKAVADAAGTAGGPLMQDAGKVQDLAKKISDMAGKGLDGASEEAKEALKKLQDSAGKLADAAGKAKDAAGKAADVLGKEVGQAVDQAKKTVEKARELTEGVVDPLVEGAKEGVEKAFDAAEAAAKQAAHKAGQTAQAVGKKLEQTAQDVGQGAEQVIDDLKEAAPSLPGLSGWGDPPAGAPPATPAPSAPSSGGSSGPESPGGGPFESILG